jgi:DNA-binding beta-propeller fold protein YncE
MEAAMLDVTIGTGTFTYRAEPGWGRLPDGWSLGDVGGIGIDRQDRVYAFNRGGHPMVVFDRAGAFLESWGEGIFKRPHGVHMGPDDTIYCTDDLDHTVRKCNLDGRVLMTIGTPGQSAPEFSGRPFNRPTHTALSPGGDIYVADGYGNARVHKFSPDGRLLTSWGEYGTDPGQFNVVHNICCDAAGRVYVADRESHRIQVFDGDGRFVVQWNNLHRPCGLYMHGATDSTFFVGELGPFLDTNRRYANIGPRVTILNNNGNLLAHLGPPKASAEEGAFIAPHTLAVDSRGDLYVGEVSYASWPAVFPQIPKPAHIHSLQKFIKIG